MTLYAHPVDAHPVYHTLCTTASCARLASSAFSAGAMDTANGRGLVAAAGAGQSPGAANEGNENIDGSAVASANESAALAEIDDALAHASASAQTARVSPVEYRLVVADAEIQAQEASRSLHRRISGALMACSIVLMLICVVMLVNQISEVRSDNHLSRA